MRNSDNLKTTCNYCILCPEGRMLLIVMRQYVCIQLKVVWVQAESTKYGYSYINNELTETQIMIVL